MAGVSAAFFCPQTKAPDERYLNELHGFLSQNPHGLALLRAVANLVDSELWETFASARHEVRLLEHGPRCLQALNTWASTGVAGPLLELRSNISSLPLLTVLQAGQYLRYLEFHEISHLQFVSESLKIGGVHGYCGGLPSAISIARASDETEFVRYVACALKVLVGIGAYTEAADDDKGAERTLLAVRLEYEGQGEHLIRDFPGAYLSGITGPRAVSIGGPAATVRKLSQFIGESKGLRAETIDLGGSAHNPKNFDIACELSRLCRDTPELQLPDAEQLHTPLRSNQTGELLLHGSLTDDLIFTMLSARCEWYSLLTNVAHDLKQSNRAKHTFAIFGWADCVTMNPFHQAGLKITKTFAKGLIEPCSVPRSVPKLPENSVAIVGASCRLPGANDMGELWNLVSRGISRAQQLSTARFDLPGSFRASQSGSLTKKRTFFGNFVDAVDNFDHAFFGISAREAANMDPQQRIMLELSFEALEDAGYLASHDRSTGDNVGCFVGLVLSEYMDNTNSHGPTAYTSTGTVPAFLCGRVSHAYGWSGPSEMFNTACSSSLVAINRACKAVQSGECRMALAGGANVITGVNNYLDLAKAGFLSPTGQCKPFDESADGYCRADGAGFVVLKSLRDALEDGDRIWGVIPGIATNQGGLSSSITTPSPTAQQSLYRAVLRQAGLEKDQISYVEAHGTGTQVGDPLEMESIRSVFGSSSRPHGPLHVGSLKGNIGHAEPAAGVAGLLKVLVMLRSRQIPPQANFTRLNPRIPSLDRDGMAISQKLVPWDNNFHAALVNSYGAAGSNAALICCDPPTTQTPPWSPESIPRPAVSYALLVSASCVESLVENTQSLAQYLQQNSQNSDLRVADLAFTLSQRRQHQKYFAYVKAERISEAAKRLQMVTASDVTEFPPPFPASESIVLTFSGQKDRRIGLPKHLYDAFPILKFYVDICDTECRKITNISLLPALWQSNDVESVAILQCGLFTVQYAFAKSWMDAGVRPRALVGHSLGELTALVISGVLSLADGIKLILNRGRLIEKSWGTEKGSMLALDCTIDQFAALSAMVEQSLEGMPNSGNATGELEIACFNGPTSLVVSGPETRVLAAESILKTNAKFRTIRCPRVNTSHGFHSALTQPILAELTAIGESLSWNEPRIPIYTCVEASNGSFDGQYPAAHARKPVQFYDTIGRLEDELGPCTWLEAGLNTPITSMTRRSCRKPDMHHFQPVATKGGDHPTDIIADVVAHLWNQRIFLNHWGYLGVTETQNDSGAPLPTVMLQSRQMWLPPYRFKKISHWVKHVDRVLEMQQKHPGNLLCGDVNKDQKSAPQAMPQPLVSRKSPFDLKTGYCEFVIHTDNLRYRSVVGGHVVCSRPLCPAPLYMECATMAMLLLLGDEKGERQRSLMFENFNVRSPLGLDPQGEVLLRMKEIPGAHAAWTWTVISGQSNFSETAHADGKVSYDCDNGILDTFERLVAGNTQRLFHNPDTEKLQCDRAYKLFQSVVEYDVFFRGMKTVQIGAQEAVATVRIPEEQPHRDDEIAAWKICDAVAIDAAVHVVGLLINTSEAMASKDVAVMVGIQRSIVSPVFSAGSGSTWTVHASFSCTNDPQQPIGDVFVCSSDGQLVAMFSGCRMTRLPVSRLTKMFDKAFTVAKTPIVQQAEFGSGNACSKPTTSSSTETDRLELRSELDTPATSQAHDRSPVLTDTTWSVLTELVAECTGMDSSQVPRDSVLGVVGLDSLGAAELAEELNKKFGLSVSSLNLLDMSLDHLQQLVGIQSPGSHPTEELSSGPMSCTEYVTEKAANTEYAKLLKILAEVTGARPEDIEPTTMLVDLGVDSLSMIDLIQEVEHGFSVMLNLNMEDPVQSILAQVGITAVTASSSETSAESDHIHKSIEGFCPSVIQTNPIDTLHTMASDFDLAAESHGVGKYWQEITPLQDEITLAYIVEGFAELGVDLRRLSEGENVPSVPFLSPKYDKLMRRLWETLAKAGAVHISSPSGGDNSCCITRGNGKIDSRSASQLLIEFDIQFPSYRNETDLIRLTGPRLADCLSGRIDSVALMFGSTRSLKIMEDYYAYSPISSTLSDQLSTYLTKILSQRSNTDDAVRILEAGGGTGGTTRWVASALSKANISYEYTFTDVSPTLVKKAKAKFASQHPDISYTTFNLENDVKPEFEGRFDIVIATNTVHATKDRTASCRRMREALSPAGGLVILAELTCHIDWCDICFGLLDGWWLADGPIAPLQTAQEWMETLADAGFSSTGYSRGRTTGASTAQLLVGCNMPWATSIFPVLGGEAISAQSKSAPNKVDYRLKTLVYKEVDGVQIHADVYVPKHSSASPMPIGT